MTIWLHISESDMMWLKRKGRYGIFYECNFAIYIKSEIFPIFFSLLIFRRAENIKLEEIKNCTSDIIRYRNVIKLIENSIFLRHFLFSNYQTITTKIWGIIDFVVDFLKTKVFKTKFLFYSQSKNLPCEVP